MKSLKERVIHLAFRKPELRPILLPLVAKSAADSKEDFLAKMEEGRKNKGKGKKKEKGTKKDAPKGKGDSKEDFLAKMEAGRKKKKKKAQKSVHEWQFAEAKKLSKVDPSIAKIMVESGDTKDKVSVKKFSAPASSLKPSQRTMILAKSLGMALFQIKTGKIGGELGAIVSSDNHIMDGHHRWSAAIFAGGSSAKVAGYKAAVPGKELVRILNVLTKGVFHRNQGNMGSGNLADYTPGNTRKMLEEFLEVGIGGDHPWPAEDVRTVLEKHFGSVEDGIEEISANTKLISKKVPSWAPAREDMPVIDEDEVPLAARKLQKGDVDWRPPYRKATTLRGNLVRLAHAKPHLRRRLLSLLGGKI